MRVGHAKPLSTSRRSCRPSSCVSLVGFTLVELLVVIAVIALLLALLIPAIQGSRESGRRTQCRNNLRQLGQAVHAHLAAIRHYPTGGWGAAWVGDPDRGPGKRQPGGWIYNLLPYLEEQALHDRGAGLTEEEKRQTASSVIQTPLAVFHCSTRRPPQRYPNSEPITLRNADPTTLVARGDYAINIGDYGSNRVGNAGPETVSDGDRADFPWPNEEVYTGVSFARSQIRARQVVDGTTTTYLIGEKYLNAKNYESGRDPSDGGNMYSGVAPDQYRLANKLNVPKLDRPERSDDSTFGGPHPGGSHFVFCDGAVRTTHFEIDPETHRRLGNRKDGETVEVNGL